MREAINDIKNDTFKLYLKYPLSVVFNRLSARKAMLHRSKEKNVIDSIIFVCIDSCFLHHIIGTIRETQEQYLAIVPVFFAV